MVIKTARDAEGTPPVPPGPLRRSLDRAERMRRLGLRPEGARAGHPADWIWPRRWRKSGLRASGRTARNIAFDELVSVAGDGRTRPSLAEGWSTSPDGLTLRVRLRPSVTFDDGKPVNAQAVRAVLQADLPEALGPAFDDIAEIRATSDLDVEFSVASPVDVRAGSARFGVDRRSDVEGIRAPVRFLCKPGTTARSKCAPIRDTSVASRRSIGSSSSRMRRSDRPGPIMLRGQVDMLYEVGVDALDSLESSNDVNIFTFQRVYAYLLLLNVQTPTLRDPAFRRMTERGHRSPRVDRRRRSEGTARRRRARSRRVTGRTPRICRRSATSRPRRRHGQSPRRLTVLFGEPSLERLAIAIQRQLQAAGIEITLEPVSADRVRQPRPRRAISKRCCRTICWDRTSSGHTCTGTRTAPSISATTGTRPSTTPSISIRRAADDAMYKAGVAAFWRAIVDDPPAVFLAWPERARAVSTRFAVPVEPDTDVLNTLHLWKPAAETRRSVRR